MHTLPVTVYYEDTDAGGVVYHANYIKFCERARTEFLQACGYKNSDLQQTHGIMFVVRRIEADYLKPAFLEDKLSVETSLTGMKNSSFIMKQTIRKDQDIIFEADVTLVCVNVNEVKPVKTPTAIREAFLNYGH